MTEEKILAEIEKVKANKMMPEALKPHKIKQLEKQLEAVKAAPAKKALASPKAAKKTASAKPAKPKRIKKTPPSPHKVNGKSISEMDCEELYKMVTERITKSKTAGKKYRTKPVIEKVAKNVEQAAATAIKNIPAEKIAQDPDKWVKKIEAVHKASLEYTQKLKDILGEDYDAAAAREELKPILDFAKEIEKKRS